MYSDSFLLQILDETHVIALVGASANPDRPSHQVALFLQSKGYKVIPVNPGLAGQNLLGEPVYHDLASIKEEVDMIDIFRQSVAVPNILDAGITRFPALKTVWMQLGVTHTEAAMKAEARGIKVVQDRCPKIEYARLIGA
jgi:predicted CoA-binding protein